MARDDLYEPTGFAGGGIDSKCSSLALARAPAAGGGADPLVSYARAGPTHDALPPFCWGRDSAMDLTPHAGHPECFDYSWAPVVPRAELL